MSTDGGEITGAQAFVRTLEAHGVEHFFNLIGFGTFPVVEAIAGSDIEYVGGVNETAVALAAEGYARATRRPAVANFYHSSGTALALMAVTVAWADRTPLVFTSTTSDRALSGRDQYAAVPRSITDVTQQYTKWGFEVPLAERIPEALDRALRIAATPPTGPVHLAFPMDLFEAPVDTAILDDIPRGARYYETVADAGGVAEAASALAAAEAPVIAAGGEVGQHGAIDQLVDLAELVGAGVVAELNTSAYLPFPTSHPLSLGDLPGCLDLLEQADVLLCVGFEFTELSPAGYPLGGPDQTVIQLSTDPALVGKQLPADIGMVGHPRPTLAALADRLRDNPGPVSARIERIESWAEEASSRLEALRGTLTGGSATPVEALVEELGQGLGDDLVVVDHAVSGSAFVHLLDLDRADQYYTISHKASAQGWGTPAAMGVQLGSPGKRVVAFIGDGGFMFTGPQALYAAARQRIPFSVVVLNDAGWGGGGYNPLVGDTDGELFLGEFRDPPVAFDALASSLGVNHLLVDDESAVGPAVEAIATADGPTLLEVPVDPEDVTEYVEATSPVKHRGG